MNEDIDGRLQYHDEPLDLANASFLGESGNDYSGASVAMAGDVNGDGIEYFIIGAWGNDDGGPKQSGAGR